ncbi:MAG TPA: oligosaccharide flippase family protein [Methanomassiliicoccales archaeon]
MIGRRSLLIVISTIVAAALSFIGLLAMTNYLGKDVYGNISWFLATVATLNIVSDLGFQNAHIKRVSEGQDENDCISTYFVVKLILTSVMVVFVFASIFVWNWISNSVMSPESWNLVILFVLYYAMYDFAWVVIYTYNARMETTKSQLIALTDPLIRVPLIIFVSVNHLTTTDLAYAYVFAAFGVLLVSAFMLKRGSFRWKKPTMFRSYIKFALPLSLIAIAGAITLNLDKMLIGYFDGTGSVAYYSSSQTFIRTFSVLGTAVAALAFPSFSMLHTKGDIAAIRKVTHAAERYISMIGTPIVALFIVFPTEICVTFFGSQFAPAGDVLRFLAVWLWLTLLNQVYNSQILGVNRPDISAKRTMGTFILNVILLFVFVPDEIFGVRMLGMSYTGAAIATAITAVALFISVRIILKKLTGTGSNPAVLKHLFAGVVAGVAIAALGTAYHFSGVIAFIVFGAVTVGVFFAVLAVLKEFTKTDIAYFTDLINPIKMLSYMGGEMKNKR